jgi:hypothetical protein
MAGTGAAPEDSLALLFGQWATLVPVRARMAWSAASECTQWAKRQFGPRTPRECRWGMTRSPVVFRLSAFSVTPSAACRVKTASCSRASSAQAARVASEAA